MKTLGEIEICPVLGCEELLYQLESHTQLIHLKKGQTVENVHQELSRDFEPKGYVEISPWYWTRDVPDSLRKF